MALITITGDCDLVKVKKGEECLAYICAYFQPHHFGFGVMCVCTIGDWLSIKPVCKCDK